MWLIVTICLSATVSEILTSEAKNGHVLLFAVGPDALNDLKFVSGVESLCLLYAKKSDF